MNRTFILTLLTAFCLTGTLRAQLPQPPTVLTPDTLNTWDLSWVSVAGRTYFVQVGDSLTSWNYLHMIELGDGNPIGIGLTASSAKFFGRLKYTDVPTTDPDLADFDGDGIPSFAELTLGTDPLVANAFVDSDNDGLLDAWEIFYWGSNLALHSAGQDTDGDGLTNKEELDFGLDPTTPESSSAAKQASYTYDLAGRLTNVVSPEISTTFTPDEEGNILSAQ